MSSDQNIQRLEQEIQRHDRLYWQDDAPEISDQAYDALVQELQRLDPKNSLLSRLQEAPQLDLFSAKEVCVADRFGQAVEHEHPMLSLNKAYEFEAIEKWFSGFDGGVVIMPKIDGIACSLRYDSQGYLVSAATRGNGRHGEDITANIIASEAVPTTILAAHAPLEVRGEVYIPTAAFTRHLADRFSNPRNTAAGAIKQKDHSATPGYHLRFFAYDLIATDQPDEDAKFERLEAIGFDRAERSLCVDFDQTRAAVEGYRDGREQLPYETDGVVIRARLAREQTRLGLTAHHPRYAMAFKFTGDVAETLLTEVHWQVARTGTITPVAQLEPVELSGAMVSRASLHHAGRVEALELAVPARVVAARRGGVIPHIEGVISVGAHPVSIPSTCPGCNSPTARRDDFLVCSAPQNCRPTRIAALIHWCRALDLEGIGQKLAEQLHDEGLAESPIDLYSLRRESLLTLPRLAEKSADNILGQIEQSRTATGVQFLVGLGIDDLGTTVARRLLDELKTIEALLEADEERLLQIDGIGSITGAGIRRALDDRDQEIQDLISVLDLSSIPSQDDDADGFLDGYWVVFTGSLESSDRKTAQAQARTMSAQTPSSVISKGQGLLVVGDRDSALTGEGRVSSKHAKARTQVRQGAAILILTETEWLGLMAQTVSIDSLQEQWQGKPR